MTTTALHNEADVDAWHPFPGWEEYYEITRCGRVRSIPRWVNSPICAGGRRRIAGKELVVQCIRGYPAISAQKPGKPATAYIHRAIATLFIPNPDGKPNVNHIDGNRSNNSVDNLEWCTQKENVRHAIETGLTTLPTSGPGEASPAAKLNNQKVSEIKKRLRRGDKHRDIAADYGVAHGTIGQIASGNTWKNIE